MKSQLIILLSISISALNLSAQKITQLKSNYQYQDQVYRAWQLGEVLHKDSVAMTYFDTGMTLQKTANTSGIISLGLLAGGTALFLTGSEACDGFCDSHLLGILFVMISPIPGIAGIIAQLKARSRKKAAINHFNNYYGLLPPSKKKNNISIGMTDKGLGLLISF